jgi:Fur family peroxide stress response transcriptional regulator
MQKKADIKKILISKGLKITPQRLAVIEALYALKNHPCAESIIAFINKKHPNISTGTVYRILETFHEKGLVQKVVTEKDTMRYDIITEKHHHLYSIDSEMIEDYFDNELNEIIEEYFSKKKIPDFQIEEFKLQIIGKFKKKK